MQVETHREDGVLRVMPKGDIDGRSAPGFQRSVIALLDPDERLVLDLGQVAFLSSAGLRALLLIHREAVVKGARVVLARVRSEIRASMAATGFLVFFTVCDSMAEAIGTVTDETAG